MHFQTFLQKNFFFVFYSKKCVKIQSELLLQKQIKLKFLSASFHLQKVSPNKSINEWKAQDVYGLKLSRE